MSMFSAMLAQVRRVPRGKVASYGDIAYAAGFPGAARQAAWALHGSGSSGVPGIASSVPTARFFSPESMASNSACASAPKAFSSSASA
jgi:hypothetical protein